MVWDGVKPTGVNGETYVQIADISCCSNDRARLQSRRLWSHAGYSGGDRWIVGGRWRCGCWQRYWHGRWYGGAHRRCRWRRGWGVDWPSLIKKGREIPPSCFTNDPLGTRRQICAPVEEMRLSGNGAPLPAGDTAAGYREMICICVRATCFGCSKTDHAVWPLGLTSVVVEVQIVPDTIDNPRAKRPVGSGQVRQRFSSHSAMTAAGRIASMFSGPPTLMLGPRRLRGRPPERRSRRLPPR